MTKRSLLTREEVLDNVSVDSDCEGDLWDTESGQEDFDDTWCPMAEGSDDDLLDLDKQGDTCFSAEDNLLLATASADHHHHNVPGFLSQELPEYVQNEHV